MVVVVPAMVVVSASNGCSCRLHGWIGGVGEDLPGLAWRGVSLWDRAGRRKGARDRTGRGRGGQMWIYS